MNKKKQRGRKDKGRLEAGETEEGAGLVQLSHFCPTRPEKGKRLSMAGGGAKPALFLGLSPNSWDN